MGGLNLVNVASCCMKRFPIKPKLSVSKRNVVPAIVCGSEAWCLKESKMGILRSIERSMVRAMCGLQLKDTNKD